MTLARKVYEGQATTDPAHCNWKHAESPFGASVVTTLLAAEELVGRTISSSRPFWLDGERQRGRTIDLRPGNWITGR